MESANITTADNAAKQWIVIVWKTEGVGFDDILGPFDDEAEAKAYRSRYRLATHRALTAPERS